MGRSLATTGMRRLLGAAAFLLVAVFALVPARAIEIQRVVSPGGMEAWLVEDHTNPIIAVRFAFDGGAALDPDGRDGLAEMVSALLDEGAGDLNSQAFQRHLEDLAVRLGFDAGRDTFGGHLRTLTRNRDAAFDLLRLAVTAPKFDDEPVARIRNQILARLRRDSEDPDTIASRTLSRALFPDHPYGRPVRGTPESIAAITTGELRQFVKQRLARANLVIGVVGDIGPGDLARLLDSTFGGLPDRAAAGRVAETKPAVRNATIVVTKPVPQSAIVFGQEGIKRDDPDFYAAYVMNHVLGGGGFTSRLYDQVREKRGLAYSVYSILYPLDHAALILGGAGTANARVAETLSVVRAEWRRLAAGGLTDKELADAKTYLTGSFPLRFTSSGRIASILVGMQRDKLGIDYLERRNSYIEAVTLDDVNRVARRILDADRLTVVVVGEPDGVTSVR
ncbi:MAG: pitrilysin family protein [Alphaproteobacteria bacterium]